MSLQGRSEGGVLEKANTVLLSIITMLCIKFPGLIYILVKGLVLLNTISAILPPPSPC